MLAATTTEQVNWWAVVLPAVLGPIMATIVGVLVARKVARRTAREEVGRSRALEDYPSLMKELAAMERTCRHGTFPPINKSVRYGSERARRSAEVIDFGWWVRYQQEGRDVLLHKQVRERLGLLKTIGDEYEGLRESVVDVVRKDLWPRIEGAKPPSGYYAIEQVIEGRVDPEYTDVSDEAIQGSIEAFASDVRLSELRDSRDRLRSEIELSRAEIRRVTEMYAP